MGKRVGGGGGRGGGDDNNDNHYDSSLRAGIANHISCNGNITNRNILQMQTISTIMR